MNEIEEMRARIARLEMQLAERDEKVSALEEENKRLHAELSKYKN